MHFGKVLKEAAGANEALDSLLHMYKRLKKIMKPAKHCRLLGAQDVSSDASALAVGSPLVAGSLPSVSNLGRPEDLARAAYSPSPSPSPSPSAETGYLDDSEAAFVAALEENVGLFNLRFLDEEESFIIVFQRLQGRFKGADKSSTEELQALMEDLLELHGDMIQLMHWSVLSYTALCKILKKHKKVTGLEVHAPFFLQTDLLNQPFLDSKSISERVDEVLDLMTEFPEHVRPSNIRDLRYKTLQAPVVTGKRKRSVADSTCPPAAEEEPSSPGISVQAIPEFASLPVNGSSISVRKAQVALDMWSNLGNSKTPATAIHKMQSNASSAQVESC